jgi:hypothetical protein
MNLPGNFFDMVFAVCYTVKCHVSLWISKNRVKKNIFGPERDEVTGGCRRLHSEELHDLCCLSNVIWVIK